MESAERNPERLFAREVVATYDRLVVRDANGVVASRPADAAMMRDVLWLIMNPDPDLREMGLYVMSAGSPRMQAELYTRVRHNDQARSEFARFVDAELRIHARDKQAWSEPGHEELLLQWVAAAQARLEWEGELFAALEDVDRDDLRRRVDELRREKVGDYGGRFR